MEHVRQLAERFLSAYEEFVAPGVPGEDLLAEPNIALAELYDEETGRVDARKIASTMAIGLKPLCVALGLNYKAVHRNPSAVSIQKSLQPLKRIMELLNQFLGSAQAIRIWINAPNPNLDGATALETILEGNASAVLLLLECAWNGVPA
jgi:hypothetical protein